MKWLSRIFSREEEFHPNPFAALGCDIHSHLIPGIDDGVKTIEEAISLIQQFYRLGYKKLILTPHIFTDMFPNTPQAILSAAQQLEEAIRQANIPIQLEVAAEYYVDYDLERKSREEKLLTFGKNYLLIELSVLNPPPNLEQIIFHLYTLGYQPVLAHPERYLYWAGELKNYQQLKERGVLFQVNLLSLIGYYTLPVQKAAMQLIEANFVDFLGSDCHHQQHVTLLSTVAKQKIFQQLIQKGKLLNITL